jgi:single-strand DNA-binding protein
MAGSLNKVMIIGNVGGEPEMRYTPSGSPVTTFRVATNRRWTTPEGIQRDETEWFSIVTWNKLAENCSRLITTGRKVYVEGRFQTRSWEDPQGQKHYRTEVVANTVLLLDSRPKPTTPEGEEGAAAAAATATGEEVEPADIPF